MKKYVRNFNSFKENRNTEPVNEEFLGAIGNLIGNIFKKGKEYINKTKGGQEIEVIYQKYLKLIMDNFKKQANIDLNLAADPTKVEPTTTPTGATASAPVAPATESVNYKIFEAEEVVDQDAKTSIENLKKKKGVLDQIVKKMKDMALKEMDSVLKKYGGGAKNPQLQIIIDNKKNQFDLDFMDAEISYLEKSGDKTMVPELTRKRDAIAKQIEANWDKMETAKAVEYKEGDEVVYLLQGKTKEDWDRLTDDEKKKVTEGNAATIVGHGSIQKLDGDKVSITYGDEGKVTEKTMAEILGKRAEGEEGYKEGDKIKYNTKEGVENEGEVANQDGVTDGFIKLKTEKMPNGFVVRKEKVIGKNESK